MDLHDANFANLGYAAEEVPVIVPPGEAAAAGSTVNKAPLANTADSPSPQATSQTSTSQPSTSRTDTSQSDTSQSRRTAHPVDGRRAKPSMDRALAEWRIALGPENVASTNRTVGRYQNSTTGVARYIPGVVRPQSPQHVAEVVRIAARHRVPLYPISTGRNWGYGAANPVQDACAIVDLSQMNRIIQFDAEAGLITLEPGVTQGQLAEYLQQHHAPFYVPVHGGGPDCSLIGNALERGYGITPHADHFAALTALEAVLPDGRKYTSALTELGGQQVDAGLKWGMGPYLDGLFSQGNLGIVTQATISLARVPEHCECFLFALRNEEALEPAVIAIRELIRDLGSVASSINLMNAERVLSMTVPYPEVAPGKTMSSTQVTRLADDLGISAWTGAGALYGPREVVSAAVRVLRRKLRPYCKRLVVFDQNRIDRWQGIARWLPSMWRNRLQRQMRSAQELLGVVTGVPQRIALPLAYWKLRRAAPAEPKDPAADACGLIWYSPLVPMKAAAVRDYVSRTSRICIEHGMEPLITLTTLSDRLFDSTVPILFDPNNLQEAARAQACYDALFAAGQEQGYLPYRVGVNQMQKVVRPEHVCWQLAGQIKQAVDPQDIIAPGRYGLSNR